MRFMELQDLKRNWQNAGGVDKTENDLLKMTKIINHPTLKKVRLKLIIESVLLLFFLIIYYDWFDGGKKPFYANALLVSSVILYIFNDVIGYISIAKIPVGFNLKNSISNYIGRIKRLSVLSLLISFLYNLSFLVFFMSFRITGAKILILVFIAALFLLSIYLSYRVWTKWLNTLKQQVKDFNFDL